MLITEIFHSIQGEGTEIGTPMLFIRTNRCNLRCRWCDSTYTFTGGVEKPLDELIHIVNSSPEEWVCLTGGEPLLQKDAPEFVRNIVDSGKKVLIETSGSLSIERYVFSAKIVIDMDIKTPSSGEEESLLMKNLGLLRDTDYVKFVISDQNDYSFARKFLESNSLSCGVVFQPAWGTDLKWLAEKALRDGLKVRVLPQLHKIIWGTARGV